jgi:hypothetical protein
MLYGRECDIEPLRIRFAIADLLQNSISLVQIRFLEKLLFCHSRVGGPCT